MNDPLRTTMNPVPLAVVVNMDEEERFDIDISRGTLLGNPFHMRGRSRQESLDLYAEYLENMVKTYPQLRETVLACQGKVLGCHCKPKDCHGDVIVEMIGRILRGEI